MHKVQLPENYAFPAHVAERPRDFKLAWFLLTEIGVAAIPPTGTYLFMIFFEMSLQLTSISLLSWIEFYTPENFHLAEDYMRFAVCKNDDVLELAKERLRGLRKYIVS